MVVVSVIDLISSGALRQYLVVQGVKVDFREAFVAAVSPAQAAQDLLEGPPHVIVPEGVNDGVEEGVALCQHQEVLLVEQHLTLNTAQAVEQKHNQAGRPAEHKEACRGQRRKGGRR